MAQDCFGGADPDLFFYDNLLRLLLAMTVLRLLFWGWTVAFNGGWVVGLLPPIVVLQLAALLRLRLSMTVPSKQLAFKSLTGCAVIGRRVRD